MDSGLLDRDDNDLFSFQSRGETFNASHCTLRERMVGKSCLLFRSVSLLLLESAVRDWKPKRDQPERLFCRNILKNTSIAQDCDAYQCHQASDKQAMNLPQMHSFQCRHSSCCIYLYITYKHGYHPTHACLQWSPLSTNTLNDLFTSSPSLTRSNPFVIWCL